MGLMSELDWYKKNFADDLYSLSQEDYSAINMPKILDSFIVFNGRKEWFPLDLILDRWINMIEHSKIYPQEAEFPHQNQNVPWNEPWAFFSYSDGMLDRTVDAFSGLVAAIERRQGHGLKPSTEPLVEEQVLDRLNIDGFAKEFLLKARRPRFRFIAPGVAIQRQEEFTNQPYRDITPVYTDTRPVLLFQAEKSVTNQPVVFDEPFDALKEYPAGLYLNPCSRDSRYAWEDSVTFILPYAIGENGWAEASDGTLMGENQEADEAETQGSHCELYTDGWNPFIRTHPPHLYRILENWKEVIDAECWDVDENGVIGGIEKFREADSEEHWMKYVIPQDW